MTDKPSIRAVLEHYGCDVPMRGRREVSVLCPIHEETRPSCSVNEDEGLIHCLGGETLVMTPEGDIPIAELAGGRPTLLTTKGWVTAPVKEFGRQELWDITMSRNGIVRTVRATDGHRWFVRNREKTTDQLIPGDRLRAVTGTTTGMTKPSHWGIAHGFTFGDGHRAARGCIASFNGHKDEALKPYFFGEPREVRPGLGKIANLPNFFKDLPDETEAPAYLYGWLAGYFAADGHVDPSGCPILTSANRKNLEFVKRVMSYRLGIFTYDIRCTMRKGYLAEPGPIYSMTFSRSSLTPDFFLIEEHRKRYEEHRRVTERKGYTVRAVERTGQVEPVYCAVVEGIGNFALSGNLLTGNCLSCGFGGDAFSVVMNKENCDYGASVKIVEGIVGESYSGLSEPARRTRTGISGAAGPGFRPRYRNTPPRGRPLSAPGS